MLSIIVAKSKNNVIGKDNKLIWRLPDDIKRFKELTKNHVIIMGRKTFESLGGILPDRKHIVLTKNNDFIVNDENVQVVNSVKEIEKYFYTDEEVFIIGGEQIYNMLLPYAKRLYITEIYKEFEGDTFFPNIDETKWKELSRQEGPKDVLYNFKYEYIIYEKK